MRSIHTEFIKLKRSMSWAVVVLLPVIVVLAGAMSTLAGEGDLDDGWNTIWIRSIGFYGMALLPAGIAILASLVWRVEHRFGNWNALMSRPVSTVEVVIGKVAAISILAAAMQLVLVVTVIALGKLIFHLPGMLPADYWFSSVVVIVACVPVAALQSCLSTLMRSFAAPVAIAFVSTGISTVLLVLHVKAVSLLPYAVATQATQLGTTLTSGQGTRFDAAEVTAGSVLFLVLMSAALTTAIVTGTIALLNRRDTRA